MSGQPFDPKTVSSESLLVLLAERQEVMGRALARAEEESFRRSNEVRVSYEKDIKDLKDEVQELKNKFDRVQWYLIVTLLSALGSIIMSALKLGKSS